MTLVFRKAKLRFVDRPPDNAPWRRLHAAADRAVPEAERAFLLALRDFRNAIDVEEFARAIALRTDADMAIVLLPWARLERSIERRLLPILREVRDGGAEVTAANLAALFRRELPVLKAKKDDPKKKPVVSGEIRFDLRNPRAEQHISQHGARLVQMVTDQTRDAIRQVVLRAQQQGGTPVREQSKQIAQALRRDVGLTVPQANALANLEAKLVEQEVGPARIKATIATRREEMIQQRARTIARTECLTAETLVDAAVVRAVFRRWYEGDVVEVRTRGGRQFTATPNHPMLTRRGWVGAGDLDDTDELVCHDGEKHLRAVGHQDVHARPATIGEIYDSLAAVGIRERRAGVRPDFHGDGMEAEIEVLRPHRLLRIGNFAPLRKPLLERVLAPAGMVRTGFCDCGALLPSNQALGFCACPQSAASLNDDPPHHLLAYAEAAADGGRSLAGLVTAQYAVGRDVLEVGRPTPASRERTARLLEVAGNPRAPDDILHPIYPGADLLGDEAAAQAGAVELDGVESVRLRTFRGHVYNIETPYGYLNIQGAYTGNTLTAANEGQQEVWRQAKDQRLIDGGVKRKWLTQRHVNANNPCPICGPMNGQIRGLEEPFVSPHNGASTLVPPMHVSCLPGDALVLPRGRVRGGSKRWFDGDLAVVQCADALPLACTPNHPVFTRRGWVPASSVNVGDEVANPLFGEGVAARHREDVHVPATAEEFWYALLRSPLVVTREVPVAAPDFHGDGVDGQVAVVAADRELRHAVDATLGQHSCDRLLVGGYMGAPELPGHSDGGLLLLRHDAPAGCPVCGSDRVGSLLLRATTPDNALRLGHSTLLYPRLPESAIDHDALNAVPFREPLNGEVFASVEPHDLVYREVVSVSHRAYSGWVYNFETDLNYYIAQGYATHNCLCVAVLEIEDV